MGGTCLYYTMGRGRLGHVGHVSHLGGLHLIHSWGAGGAGRRQRVALGLTLALKCRQELCACQQSPFRSRLWLLFIPRIPLNVELPSLLPLLNGFQCS